MVFGISCPACDSTAVRLGAPETPSWYRFQCDRCGVGWTARLPLAGIEREAIRSSDPGPGSSAPRILVLDDDADVTAAVGAALSDLGDVYTATTSAQALALAHVVKPDLGVIDIILPRMDGFAVVETMRRMPGLAAVPIIFITGSDRIDVAVRARELGVPTLLYKPLDDEVLRDAAAACLRRSHPAAS
jgi:CheY-like chemotaxis protein